VRAPLNNCAAACCENGIRRLFKGLRYSPLNLSYYSVNSELLYLSVVRFVAKYMQANCVLPQDETTLS
jgi:hypothetical protein